MRRMVLRGCDDETRIEFSATDDEMQVLLRIAAKSRRIGGGCMPTMHIEGDPDDTNWDWASPYGEGWGRERY